MRSKILIILLAAAAMAAAQPPQQQRIPTPNDTLVSPEVATDGRVTFRIYAPKASEVTVGGDFLSTPGPRKLERDDKGVWSLTMGPLEPDHYNYTYTVDGVRTLDPKNANIKQGVSSIENMFEVPGASSAFQDNRMVPHGEIRKVWYRSSTLDQQRRLHIYFPAGYDGGKSRYPVFYLLHGGGDEDSGWSTIGRAGFILDNLIAGKKAVPMLVVMPNGSLPRPTNMPPMTPGAPPSPELAAAMAALQARFTNELMKDVIPFVEKNYRVQTGRDHRAIAGLSMGGGQTLRVITSHPDEFAWAAIWSAGVNPQTTATFEKTSADFLGASARINKQMKLLSLSAGDKDFALAGSKNLDEIFTRHGIQHKVHVSGGGHTWINWRHYLNEFAPQLFR